jgi:hypothetical protein
MRFLFRCPECRTRRRDWHLMKAHQAKHEHHFCFCSGYHFKHRKGSPRCHHNPLSPILEVLPYGADEVLKMARAIIKDRRDLAERVEWLCERLGIQFNN